MTSRNYWLFDPELNLLHTDERAVPVGFDTKEEAQQRAADLIREDPRREYWLFERVRSYWAEVDIRTESLRPRKEK